MSSIWRCTVYGSKDIDARIKGMESQLLYRTVFNNASRWMFMVNYGSGCGRDRERRRRCEKTVIWR